MKRKHTAAALLLAVCMSFGAYMPASASAADINYGDVNLDGKVDSSDATEVLITYSRLSTGSHSLLSAAQETAGDLTGDGKLDASDATMILQYYSYLATGGQNGYTGFIGGTENEKLNSGTENVKFNGKWEGEKAVISGLATIRSYKGKPMYELFALEINGDDIKLHSKYNDPNGKTLKMDSEFVGDSLKISANSYTALLTLENGMIKMEGDYSDYAVTVYMKKVDSFTADFQ
ncbi:MAG TPA: dockerin type I domain-containing protein [Ruminococcus sp.]|nr:dockerin type I domain-containing protein [Ruminococcus sp.]